MGEFSPWHILLILIVGFLLFGGKRLPELGRTLAETIREFKKAMNEAAPTTQPAAPEEKKATSAPTAIEAKVNETSDEPKSDAQ
jgi:sec-independent protein translocase protein TatA